VPLYHIDLYRLEDEDEIWSLGIDEYLYGDGVVVIEWAERMTSLLPDDRLDVTLSIVSDQERRIVLEPRSERLMSVVERVVRDARSRY